MEYVSYLADVELQNGR